MKKLLLLVLPLLLLAGCDIYIYQDPYVVYDDRDMFVGRYQVEEYSQTTGQFYNYRFDISKSYSDQATVIITNFYGAGLEVYATVYDSKITIPWQVVAGYEIEGTGRLVTDRLVFTYVVRDVYVRPAFTDFVDAEAWLY